MCKRAFDIVFSCLGLLFLSPALLVLGILVKISDGGSVLFRQERVGQWGRPFRIVKFRSMVPDAERQGLSVTKAGDSRMTRVGRFMRKYKLDELPQLWNVLHGEMSFVGPRPEVSRYVEQYTEAQKRVLALKPGITDVATLEFRNEEELLSGAGNVERFYVENCIPRKIELNLTYAQASGFWTDLKVILRTLCTCCHRECEEATTDYR